MKHPFIIESRSKILTTLRSQEDKEFFKRKLAKKIGINISYFSLSLNLLKQIGLTKENKKDRRIYISLTDKGKKVADILIKIEEIMK